MKGKIAVELALGNVKDYLTEIGYTVECMPDLAVQPKNKWRNYDAIVVSGLSQNLLGIQDTVTKAVVINADGLTPREVAARLSEQIFH